MEKKRTLPKFRNPPPPPPHTHETPEISIEDEMEGIQSILKYAYGEGFLTEVVWSALTVMKNDPSLTRLEALSCGYDEWVK